MNYGSSDRRSIIKKESCPCCGEEKAILTIQLPLTLPNTGLGTPIFNIKKHSKSCPMLKGRPADRREKLLRACHGKYIVQPQHKISS